MAIMRTSRLVIGLTIVLVSLCIPCMTAEHAEFEAVVHHEGVRYAIVKLVADGDSTAKWFTTDVASAVRKDIKIPTDISGVVVVDDDRAFYLDRQGLVRISLLESTSKVVAQPIAGLLADAYLYAGGYILILADPSGWHYLRTDGAGKTLVSLDIPVVGNLRTSTIQSGILIMSFAGENNVGTNIFRIDLANNKLLPHSDLICTLKDLGVEIWLTHIFVRHAGATFLCPFDSPLQYFKRYRQDYILCTLQRLVCISSEKEVLLSARDAQDWTFDGQIVLTAKGPIAIEPSGKILFDLFAQQEQESQ